VRDPRSPRRTAARGDASGRRGSFHTFCNLSEPETEVHVAALTTYFDFDDPEPTPGSTRDLLAGKAVTLVTTSERGADTRQQRLVLADVAATRPQLS